MVLDNHWGSLNLEGPLEQKYYNSCTWGSDLSKKLHSFYTFEEVFNFFNS